MNKKGELVLRDIVFMMMMVSAIFILSGLFVSEMAFNYDNTNMSNEWALSQTNDIANSTFYDYKDDVSTVGQDLGTESTGIWALIESSVNLLTGLGDAFIMVMTAPNVIGNMVAGTLEDAGVNVAITLIIKWLIVTVFWIIIIFTIISAFLRGGKV